MRYVNTGTRKVADNRKVQTAVIDSPASDRPAVLPMDRDEAARFREQYGSRSFWCGEHVNGCGGQLAIRIPGNRIAHFMHLKDANGRFRPCARRAAGEDSADHLYVRHALVEWLSERGIGSETRYLEDVGAGVDVFAPSLRLVIAVRLAGSDVIDWQRQDEDLRQGDWHVEWIFGPNAGLAASACSPARTVWRVRCSGTGMTRSTEIGAQEDDGVVRWIAFDRLSPGAGGIREWSVSDGEPPAPGVGQATLRGETAITPPPRGDSLLGALEDAYLAGDVQRLRCHYMAVVWCMFHGEAEAAAPLRAKLTRYDAYLNEHWREEIGYR